MMLCKGECPEGGKREEMTTDRAGIRLEKGD